MQRVNETSTDRHKPSSEHARTHATQRYRGGLFRIRGMAGVEDRVKEFLKGWPKVKERLEEAIQDEGLFHGDRACRTLPGESENDLQATMGEGDPGL